MPGARTHDLITVVTVVIADALYLTKAPHPDANLAILFTAAYLFAGYACAGDLDLDSREYRRWGPLRCIWWPYRQCVPHRSWVSHGLILGGLIRVAYLLAVTTFLIVGGAWTVSQIGPHLDPTRVAKAEWRSLFALVKGYPKSTGALLAGFVLAGTTHSLADMVSTGFKRRFYSYRRY